LKEKGFSLIKKTNKKEENGKKVSDTNVQNSHMETGKKVRLKKKNQNMVSKKFKVL